MVTLIFLQGLCGYVRLNILTLCEGEGTDVAVKRRGTNKKAEKYAKRKKDFMEKCNFTHIVQILQPYVYVILEYCIQGSVNQFYISAYHVHTIKLCADSMC